MKVFVCFYLITERSENAAQFFRFSRAAWTTSKQKLRKFIALRFSRRTRCFPTRAPCSRKKDENVLLEVVKIRVLRLKNASTRCFILTSFWRWEETATEQENEVFLFSFMALEKCSIKNSYPIWFNKLALVFKCLSMTFRVSRKIVLVWTLEFQSRIISTQE